MSHTIRGSLRKTRMFRTISRTDVLLLFSGLFFLYLEVVLFSGLRFTTTYLQAHLIIAVGILGLLAGGILAQRVSDERTHTHLSLTAHLLMIAPLLGFLGVVVSEPYPWGSVALFAAVFIPLGLLIGLLYRMSDPRRAYAFELFGAAVGVMAAALILPALRAENALLCALVVGIGVITALWWNTKRLSQKILFLSLLILSVALLFNNLNYDRLNFIHIAMCDISQSLYGNEQTELPKIFCEMKLWKGDEPYEVVLSKGSLVDRVDIVHVTGQQKYLTAFSGAQTDILQPYESNAYTYDARIPVSFFSAPKTLIIGMGAEGVSKVVTQTGANDITAVDLNPVITDLWRSHERIISYSEQAYQDAQVHTIDGRSYLESTEEQFDLITMMNTHRTRNAAHFGEPDFLHTKEAFSLIFERLTDDGVFVFEEPNFFGKGTVPIQKILVTLQNALAEAGVTEPHKHIALYTWAGAPADTETLSDTPFMYTQVLVSRSQLSDVDIHTLNTWSQTARLTTNRIKENNMVFHKWLWPPALATTTLSTSEETLVHAMDDGKGPITITDNKPFPVSASFTSSLMTVGTLVVFIFAVVIWYYVRQGIRTPRLELATTGYFICIGLGYAAVEVLLLQWFNLYLGSITVSFVVTLSGLLLASGVISMYANTQDTSIIRTLAHCLLLLLALIITLFTLPDIWYPSSFTLRVLVALFLSIGIGGTLGLFFPRVLSLVRPDAPRAITILVALNGSALAVGIVLSFLATPWLGFMALGLCVFILYTISVALLWYRLSEDE